MNPVWNAIFDEIPDVNAWNLNMPRLVQENGDEFKKAAQAEAVGRGYVWSKMSRCYLHPWMLEATNHGTRLLGVGWRNGVLRTCWVHENKTRNVRIKSFYEHGTKEAPVPIETQQKLISAMFPEKLFGQIVKEKYPSQLTDRIEETL